MGKFIRNITIVLIGIFIISEYGYIFRNYKNVFNNNGIEMVSRTNGKNFEIYKNGIWEKDFLEGISMGAAKPGYYPGDFGITKEDYLRWFKYISDMNVEVIRIYTLHMPEFYEALFEFNKHREKPLYLIQGVWVDEETMVEKMNLFDKSVINDFKLEINSIIDVIHGNADVEPKIARGHGNYKKDISPYVIGYVLGVEWDPIVVNETNIKNKDIEQFDGKWLFSENSKPVEVFFANVGDSAIDYEMNNYNSQKPIAFTNWLPTDIIPHENEPEIENRLVDIDTQTVKSKDVYKAGLFASYHIYPYYPDFLSFEPEYKEYRDPDGNPNSYRAYLKDLISRYDIPVIVGEFGVPTSRGISHEDRSRGFNQGLIEEKAQGEMCSKMINEIYEEGYAGTLLFTWQDEWFKRTWNTKHYDYEDSRAYWSDKMTNEKYFGVLSFDPGEKESKVYVDGETKEWKSKSILYEDNKVKLNADCDEEYLYFKVKKDNLDLTKEDIIIPIDVTSNSGSKTIEQYSITTSGDADFAIVINGKDDARVLVSDYYDIYKYYYEKGISTDSKTSKFNPIRQCVMGENILPLTGELIPQKAIEVGELIYGNGNPKSKDFNSLADYYINEDEIEIRIPWLMLNIADPSSKKIIGDFNKNNKITYIDVDTIGVGLNIINNGKEAINVEMQQFYWEPWEMPKYHERLKESYYMIQKTYKDLD